MVAGLLEGVLLEGVLLGWCQAQLLHRWQVLPRRRDWAVTTSAGAGVAWSIGLIPSTVDGLGLTPGTVVIVALGGLLFLLSLPVSQYLLLRRHLHSAWRWIPINVLAWSVGLLWTLAPSLFTDEQTPVTVLVIAYAVAGLGMASTMALVSGLGLRRLLAAQSGGAVVLGGAHVDASGSATAITLGDHSPRSDQDR